MKHDYGHYSIATPTIKDHFGAVEDAAGSIRVSHTLVGSLIDGIEGMQDIVCQQKEFPGSISPDAVTARIETLWALAQSIDERMKNDIILLEAAIDQQPGNQRLAA